MVSTALCQKRLMRAPVENEELLSLLGKSLPNILQTNPWKEATSLSSWVATRYY